MTWQPQSLDELGFVSRGRSRHRPRDAAHLYGGAHPFVQTGDVKHAGLYLNEHSQTYSEAGLAQSRMWPPGTLCITIAANIADTAILGIDACFPDSVIGFIPDEGKADARFVKYLFDAMLKKQFKQFTQGAAQDNLSQGKLLSLKFPIPPVTEQRQIADVLSTYDNLIENNQRRIQLLEQAARLLYKEWFVHLRFPGHEHVKIKNGVPEGWEEGVVSDFYSTASGGTPSRKKPDFYSGDVPWVKTRELTGGFILSTEERITEEAIKSSSAKLFPRHTVLVAMYGATIGQTAILSVPSASNQACCAVTPLVPGVTYAHAYLFFNHHKADLVGLGQGAAQNNISQQVIKAFEMVLPTKGLLYLFSESVCPLFDQIEALQSMNVKLMKVRDLLLPRLMNGRIPMS